MSWFGWKKKLAKKTAPKSLAVQKLNFLSDEAARRFLEYGRSTDAWDKGNAGTRWDGRVIHSSNMPPDLEKLAVQVLSDIQAAIHAEFQPAKPVYPDGIQLVRWLPGDYQEPHADAENPDGNEHPFSWRRYAALIYLNLDFEGGDLYFPHKKLRMRPWPKSLAMFPGTVEYLHEVEEVSGGTRYTLASFWTDDPAHAMYPEIFAKVKT